MSKNKKREIIRDWSGYRPATRAVRAGQVRTEFGEHSEPIFTTSSFVFESAAQAAARFAGDEPGYIYGRFTNPTVDMFADRLAALEGGEAAIATSSGMAAICLLCMGALQASDHVVVSRHVFGTTQILFRNILSRFGIEHTFVDLADYDGWQQALKKNTRLCLFETPANPLTEVGDIKKIADISKSYNEDILVCVDNCFCTPALQLPLQHGADVIIHSATKYLDGQGRAVGGAVVGSEALIEEKLLPVMRSAGLCMSPFNAWLFLKGLETLQLRMEQICANADHVARALSQHKKVTRVNYPGLEEHPQYDVAQRQQLGAGGVLSFEVEGGREAAWSVIDQTRMLSITANLGDTRTTVTHPATTTHGRLNEQELAEAGITEGLVRLAIGLEDPQDVFEDLRF